MEVNVFDDQTTAEIKRLLRQEVRKLRGTNEQIGTRWHKKGGKGGGCDRVGFELIAVEGLVEGAGATREIPSFVMVGKWIWHTQKAAPKDAYDFGGESVIDVFDIGCLVDVETQNELMAAIEYQSVIIYGEATRGLFKDTDEWFWKLDHPLCYLEKGPPPISTTFVGTTCCPGNTMELALTWEFTSGWGGSWVLDDGPAGNLSFDYLGQVYTAPQGLTAPLEFVPGSVSQYQLVTATHVESMPYEYTVGLNTLVGRVEFRYHIRFEFQSAQKLPRPGCVIQGRDDLIVRHFDVDGVQQIADIRTGFCNGIIGGGTSYGILDCNASTQTVEDFPFSPGACPRAVEWTQTP